MNRLKELRKEKDLTQEQLGLIIGVESSAISKYERNTVPIPIDNLIMLSNYFNVSTDYILGITQIRAIKEFEHDLTDEQRNTLLALAEVMKSENKNKERGYYE